MKPTNRTPRDSHMPAQPPTVHKSIYYWPSFEAARAWAKSQSVTITSSVVEWPRIVRYTRGFAIQLVRSGNYLGPQHVGVIDAKGAK